MVSNPISNRVEVASLPKIGDVFGYNMACAKDDAELAARRYEYALEQRDKLNERIRFGALTLNAASLAGLATFVGDEKKQAAFGVTNTVLGLAAVFFGLGIIAGCFAIWTNANHFTKLAGDAFKFRSDARHKFALFEERISESSESAVSDALDKKPSPAPDFAFSLATIAFTNTSGACWMAGFGSILATVALKFC